MMLPLIIDPPPLPPNASKAERDHYLRIKKANLEQRRQRTAEASARLTLLLVVMVTAVLAVSYAAFGLGGPLVAIAVAFGTWGAHHLLTQFFLSRSKASEKRAAARGRLAEMDGEG